MENELLILLPIFFLIALFYSSAGFGGGSSYLAILALFPIEFATIRFIALFCNITVVSASVFLFYKNGVIKFKRILPLILLSIPLAYIGGRFRMEEKMFFILLGFTLLVASLLMLVQSVDTASKKLPFYSNGIIGGAIGFLSGLVGIGGGIFLSPVLHLTKWARPLVIAATTALFILVNSIAGLIGQLSANELNVEMRDLIALMIAVFVGGQIGSRLTINKLAPQTIKKVTGILIFLVSIRILYKYLF